MVRVVVLNWNAAWLTARCLRSLLRTAYPADRLEIVVVDNASIDGSLATLRNDFPTLRFIENESNLGFAEGCNRAMRAVDGVDFVALVNNDATVEPGWLEPLLRALDNPSAGAAVPKMLLESPFAAVTVTGRATITSIDVDGINVTRRCVSDDLGLHAHPTVPLALVRRVEGTAVIHVPVAASSPRVTLTLEPRGEADTIVTTDIDSVTITGEAPGVLPSMPRMLTIELAVGASRTTRINSLGTDLKPWTEGFERWFGEVDRPNLATHETWGFSGGGVLLRAAMLSEVGLFDPAFFAYYEDTDLAWRARRKGWKVVCAPDSVVHHLHGGSAGPEAQGFFFLNYRNWLLTVARNGSPRQMLRAAGVVRRLSWPAFRANVFGTLRRGRRPDTRIVMAWTRVLAGVAARLAPTLRARWTDTVTTRPPVTSVRSRLMPSTPPRPPRQRSGGPVLCYVDVTETLRSGWRAGIQRVVCELVRNLPGAEPDLELVPICWSKVHHRFRRVDAAEQRSLLSSTGAQQPATPPPAPHPLRRTAAAVMHATGSSDLVRAIRRHRELSATSPEHRMLLLDRFEPGSVFLDVDASWNPTTQDRSELLPSLQRHGVHTARFVHDLLPQTHPDWFIPQLVDVSTAHLDAHLDAGSLLLCNSEHTLASVEAYASGHGRPEAEGIVVPMGATTPTSVTADADPTSPYFLTVGTIEPRKNHSVVLDAFERVRETAPDARLVIVGRPGWNSDALIRRLEASGADGVEWRHDVSDAELDSLYAGARAVIAASITEGFGLPVIEALQRGAVVLASRGGALAEAGGDLAEYFDPTSPDELHKLMLTHLHDESRHHERRELVATYTPPTWRDAAVAIGAALVSLARS